MANRFFIYYNFYVSIFGYATAPFLNRKYFKIIYYVRFNIIIHFYYRFFLQFRFYCWLYSWWYLQVQKKMIFLFNTFHLKHNILLN